MNRSRFSVLFAAFVGASLVPALAVAQLLGVISGTVTDEDNRPLPGTRITIVSDDDSLRRSTITDAKGRYEVADLAVGTYTVNAELIQFDRASKSQRVTGSRREVWLVMKPAKPEREQLPQPRVPVQIAPLQGR